MAHITIITYTALDPSRRVSICISLYTAAILIESDSENNYTGVCTVQ